MTSYFSAIRTLRRNLSDEVRRNGFPGTLSWVSQSLADWSVGGPRGRGNVKHPRPIDVALGNYYNRGHTRSKHCRTFAL